MAILRIPLVIAAAVILVLFIGLRDQVGTDWPTYELIYNQITNIPLIAGLILTEPGYAICNYLAHAVGSDIHLVNFICAALMIAGLLRFSYLVKIDPCITLFLSTPYLLFVVGMGYTRQAVAIGLALCAIGYLAQGRYRLFYVWMLCAGCFHYSALVLILLHWLRTWRRVMIVAVLSLAAIPHILAILSDPRYGQYLNEQSSGVWFRLTIVLLGSVAVFVYREHWKSDPIFYDFLKRGSIVCAILTPIATIDSTIVDRLCLYLFFIYLAGMGRAIRYSRVELRGAVAMVLVGMTYAEFLLWFGLSSYAASYWIPYRIATN